MRLSAFHITLCFCSRDDRLHESVTGRENRREGRVEVMLQAKGGREVTGGEEGERCDKGSKGEEKGQREREK